MLNAACELVKVTRFCKTLGPVLPMLSYAETMSGLSAINWSCEIFLGDFMRG